MLEMWRWSMRRVSVFVILILLLAIGVSVASAQNITWYSSDYKQKIPITISYSGTEDISDYYQINVTLDGVYYTLSGLLFTDADNETVFPFWNESELNTNIKVWVNVTGITNATDKVIWAYINGSDVLYANSNATFNFFDDFTSGGFTEVWDSGVIATGTQADTARNIIIDGNYLYAVSSSARKFVIYNISDPTNPSLESITDLTYNGIDIRKKDNYVFISCEVGVFVYNVSNVSSPSLVTTVDLGVRTHGMYLAGDYLYTCQHRADSFTIIDVSNPEAPVVRGKLNGTLYFNGAHDVVVDGNYAFVTNYQATAENYSLTVVNVSDPDNPVVVNGTAMGHQFSHLYKVGNYLYVGSHDPDTGLFVFDVSDPTSPVLVNEFLSGVNSIGYWIDLYDNYTIVAVAPKPPYKVYLIDISDRENPSLKSVVSTDLAVENVRVMGNYVYVSLEDVNTYEWHLRCYHLTEPASLSSGWSGIEFNGAEIAVTNDSLVLLSGADTSNGAGVVSSSQFSSGNYTIEAKVKREQSAGVGEPGLIVSFTDKTSQETTYYGYYDRKAGGSLYKYSTRDQMLKAEYDDAVVYGDSTIPDYGTNWTRVIVNYIHSAKQVKATFVYPDGSKYTLTTSGTNQLTTLYLQLYYAEYKQAGAASYCDWVFVHRYVEPEPIATVGTPHYGGGSKIGKNVTNLIGTNGLIDYGTAYPSELLDMYITPAVDIIKAYDADYDASTNTWTVTVHSDISQAVSFNISTGLANQEFNIYRNGSLIATVTTTSDGWLNWTYTGGFSTWVFTFEPAEEEEEEEVKEDWITVEPTSISVEVAKGSTKTESIKIKNNMDIPITVTLGFSGINRDEVYVTYPKLVYLNCKETKEVKVRFKGLKEGTYDGNLFVCANKCYRIPVTVKVKEFKPPIIVPTPPKPVIPGFEAIAALAAALVAFVAVLVLGRVL
ncbi:MAG TPA: DUF2341 domain-containing protein [Archaeoglobus sp.]|nr:DUF2341 domain-containing protein [Archaeoglobus sp.]